MVAESGCGALVAHLPNGMTIRHIGSPEEIQMLYREHFVEEQYIQRGVKLREGDTVVDVGAHVGLFAIYAARAVGPTGRVLCIEPAPATHGCCVANTRPGAIGAGAAPVTVANVACGDGSAGALTLTVYDRASVMNTVAAGRRQQELMSAYLYSQVAGGASNMCKGAEAFLFRLAKAALRVPAIGPPVVKFAIRTHVRNHVLRGKREVTVRAATLGSLLREHGIRSVGLLKVDAECAELSILRGLGPEDWANIRQVAMEVHEERFKRPVLDMLAQAGFADISIESSEDTLGRGVYTVWATRG